MPIRNLQSFRDYVWSTGLTRSVMTVQDYQDWARSPRVNGKLQLRDNRLERVYGRVVSWQPLTQKGFTNLPNGPVSLSEVITDQEAIYARLSNEAYARLRGKLYKGNASLGVTSASFKQSRDMIVRDYQRLNNRADFWTATLGRRKYRNLADLHLEVIFGWAPLIQDIHAAASTVIQMADVRTFVKARASTNVVADRLVGIGDYRRRHSTNAMCHVTWAVTVQVANLNRWLAERAGLHNPVAVAWDLVPWSFAVNMFVNTGALVNSITDFAGLSFPSQSVTRSRRGPVGTRVEYRETGVSSGQMVTIYREKSRTVNTPLRPSLDFRWPGVNWETAAMAASLFTQKLGKLKRLIASVPPGQSTSFFKT